MAKWAGGHRKMPPYKPEEILQSLSGHNLKSQKLSTANFGSTFRMGHFTYEQMFFLTITVNLNF